MAGDVAVCHDVAFGEKQFLTAVNLIKQSEFIFEKYEWTHINIWGFPYYMKTDGGKVKELVLQDGEDFVKCAKAEFKNLMYHADPPLDKWDKMTGGFWGFPELIRYDKSRDATISSLFFIEKRSQKY